MKMRRLRRMVAAWMVVCACNATSAQKVDDGIWGDPEISVAVEKIRKGENADLMRLTSKAKTKSSWKPAKKSLPKYHECLGTNENPKVQFFAVAAIGRLKDKSSMAPLQTFIMTAQHRLQEGTISHEEEEKDPAKTAQRRQKGGLLSREESVMLQRSIGVAMETLGEIDGDTDLSVAFLGTLLKHDMQKEWGGGVAHSALAKKGAPGLRRLLEESLTAEGEQCGYVGSAISGIRDPALFGALSVACLDPKYSDKAGGAVLGAIAKMRDRVPQAEQFIVDILMRDEKSNLRLHAASCVAEFKTEKGFKMLMDLRNAPSKGGEELVQHIDHMLTVCYPDKMINSIVNTILSPVTPNAEKIRLCQNMALMDPANADIKYVAILSTCLNVTNEKGEPLNEARVSIWRNLYDRTKTRYPLTLAYENDQQFERLTYSVRDTFRDEYRYRSNGKYPYEQHERLAEEATKQMIKKWVKRQAEMGGNK